MEELDHFLEEPIGTDVAGVAFNYCIRGWGLHEVNIYTDPYGSEAKKYLLSISSRPKSGCVKIILVCVIILET